MIFQEQHSSARTKNTRNSISAAPADGPSDFRMDAVQFEGMTSRKAGICFGWFLVRKIPAGFIAGKKRQETEQKGGFGKTAKTRDSGDSENNSGI